MVWVIITGTDENPKFHSQGHSNKESALKVAKRLKMSLNHIRIAELKNITHIN